MGVLGHRKDTEFGSTEAMDSHSALRRQVRLDLMALAAT